MNLTKYSPKFINLKKEDKDAYNLLLGFIRENNPSQIAYAILSLIFNYWYRMKIIKLLQLAKKYKPNSQILKNSNQKAELAKSTSLFEIGECQYKFAITIDDLMSVHIYPFSGIYNDNNNVRAEIKTKEGSTWKALRKNIKIKFEVYKANSCEDKCLKRKQGSYIKMYLNAGTPAMEGLIDVKIHSNLDEYSLLQMILWEEHQVQQEGYTICEQCQCQTQSSSAKIKKGWVFIE